MIGAAAAQGRGPRARAHVHGRGVFCRPWAAPAPERDGVLGNGGVQVCWCSDRPGTPGWSQTEEDECDADGSVRARGRGGVRQVGGASHQPGASNLCYQA